MLQAAYLSYEELLAYRAAILVPWDANLMTFYELYFGLVPLFVPALPLLAKWQAGLRWGITAGGPRDVAAGPWVRAPLAEALVDAARVLPLTVYYTFPHLAHFASLTDLVRLLREDLPEKRAAAVRGELASRLGESASTYAALLPHLLSGAR